MKYLTLLQHVLVFFTTSLKQTVGHNNIKPTVSETFQVLTLTDKKSLAPKKEKRKWGGGVTTITVSVGLVVLL